MHTLYIENVHCFGSPGPIPLAPLTLLVGDNGTGKTTILSCARLAARLAACAPAMPDLREAPRPWGWVEKDSGEPFAVGFGCGAAHTDGPEASPVRRLVGRFSRRADYGYALDALTVTTEAGVRVFALGGAPGERDAGAPGGLSDADRRALADAGRLFPRFGSVFLSDPSSEFWKRETPTFVYDLDALVVLRGQGGEQRERLCAALAAYGEATGQFDAVSTRPQEGKGAGAFYVSLDPKRHVVRPIETGHGLGHILALILELVYQEPGSLCLLQQPDAFLDPRAQAALGTLLGALVGIERKQILVETHSEFLIRRVRADVRDGHLRPQDVLVLFLERQGEDVAVHPIRLDARGELLGVPPGYRRFFLEAERRGGAGGT